MTGLPSIKALEGTWLLRRSIEHQDGRIDRFEGQAIFSEGERGLVQNESGQLTTEAGVFQASRRYIWCAKGEMIEVFFDDMRLFHSVQAGVEVHKAHHFCPPDDYRVKYDFSEWPHWSSTWTVVGPRKSYRMTTHFELAST